MSADNWAICPRCLANAKATHLAESERDHAAYGSIPADEWRARLAALEAVDDEEKFRTFREDYEFYGAKDGTITADYSGHCQVCHVGLDFKTEHPFFDAAASRDRAST